MDLGSTSSGLCSSCPGEKASCSRGQSAAESRGVGSPAGESSAVSRRTERCEGRQESSAGQPGELARAAGNREELCLCLFSQVRCCRGEVFRLPSS